MENLERAIEQIKAALPGLNILENEPLSRHSSFKIGGPARAFAAPADTDSFTAICRILKENELCPFLLGNGTNILFPDEGLKKLFVLSTEMLTEMRLLPDGAIYAEAGVSLAKLASFAHQHSLSGLEFASGIPGSVGGGVLMNAGAYGGELKDTVESVAYYDLPRQELCRLEAKDCDFGYRSSFFHKTGGCAILGAVFRLEKGDSSEIAAKMRELNERRRDKQPLDLPSAGSAFKRPEGYFAAALIEQAGLKGYSVGGAQVSEKHSGFVVNKNNATAADVHQLMRDVRRIVFEKFGVVLEPEIIMLSPDYVPEENSPALPGSTALTNEMN